MQPDASQPLWTFLAKCWLFLIIIRMVILAISIWISSFLIQFIKALGAVKIAGRTLHQIIAKFQRCYTNIDHQSLKSKKTTWQRKIYLMCKIPFLNLDERLYVRIRRLSVGWTISLKRQSSILLLWIHFKFKIFLRLMDGN